VVLAFYLDFLSTLVPPTIACIFYSVCNGNSLLLMKCYHNDEVGEAPSSRIPATRTRERYKHNTHTHTHTHTHSNNIGTASTHAAVAVLVMSLIPITRSKKQPSEALAWLTAIHRNFADVNHVSDGIDTQFSLS